MDKKDLKNIERMEKIEKATHTLDRGVVAADEKISQVPSMLGSHKPKIILALVLLMVVALFRDPSLVFVLALIAAVLYSSKIVSAVKMQMLKKAAKKQIAEIASEPEKDASVTVLEVKKED